METEKQNYSYIFIFSGIPVPRHIERIHAAVEAGHNVAVAYLKRPGIGMDLGEIRGANVVPLQVAFRKTGINRILAFPRLVRQINSEVLQQARKDAFLYIDSLDILAAVRLGSSAKEMSIRYEVRDLQHYQMSPGIAGRLVRIAERLLMPHVDRLIVTSMAYYDRYYKKFYKGPVTLLENLPDLVAWDEFRRKPVETTGPVVVGLVGIIRYIDCTNALIEGARLARRRGADIRLKIAGPVMSGHLLIEPEDDWVERSGPFDYSTQIKCLYSDVDLLWSVYDTRIENVRLALSNKLYESIISGIPIAVAAETHIGDRVHELEIGQSVDCLSVEKIADLLCSIRTGKWYDLACARLADGREKLGRIEIRHQTAEQEALFDRGLANKT